MQLYTRLLQLANKNIDKVAHCLVSFTLLLFLDYLLPIYLNVIVVSLLGIYKEYKDTNFDKKDLAADLLGIIIGVVYLWLIK